jgi:uncharacterized cupin superfamily protein
MNIINTADVPVEHRRSPRGIYELRRQHLTLALGGKKDLGPWGGGQPFDLELATIPAGKKNFPLHAHAAQTEHYLIMAGRGLVRDEQGHEYPLRAGDCFISGPGDAHELSAADDEALTYLVVADHHRADITRYPRTGKRQLKPEYRVIQPTEADYYAGEE